MARLSSLNWVLLGTFRSASCHFFTRSNVHQARNNESFRLISTLRTCCTMFWCVVIHYLSAPHLVTFAMSVHRAALRRLTPAANQSGFRNRPTLPKPHLVGVTHQISVLRAGYAGFRAFLREPPTIWMRRLLRNDLCLEDRLAKRAQARRERAAAPLLLR